MRVPPPSLTNDDPVSRIAADLGDYLSGQLGHTVRVANIQRLAGGASHATWAFDSIDAKGSTDSFVLRQDFETALIEADCGTEFKLLTALYLAGQPVPRPCWASSGHSALSTPFMISERMAGSDVRKAIARGDIRDQQSLGERLAAIQAGVHALDWRRQLAGILVEPGDNCALIEVERWAATIEERSEQAGPLLRAALGWLRSNTPGDAELSLVHADFKTNNVLVDGPRYAVADWEMSHIGDPLEDLAWTMLWTTEFDLVGGLLSPEEYIAAYSRHAQRTVDRSRLFFWQIFSLVKLSAIFLRGAVRGPSGAATRPTLGLLGRGGVHLETQLANCLLAALGRRGSS